MVDRRRIAAWCCAGTTIVAAGCSGGSGGSEPLGAASSTTATTATRRPDLGHVDDEPTGSGPLVAIVGDSLTASSRRLLIADLPDRSVLIGALFGEGWADGPFSHTFGADPPVIVQATLDYAARHPDALVLALGTNDAWNPVSEVDDALRQIDRTLTAIDPTTCVVLVEVDEHVPEQADYDGDEAARINERLAARADVTVPWNDITETEGGWLADDGIHLRAAGKRARSALIADAVASCPDDVRRAVDAPAQG